MSGSASVFPYAESDPKPDFQGDRELEAAYEIAREVHADEYRRNGLKYITHPVLVYDLIDAFGESNKVEDKILKGVALLHDTLETQQAGLRTVEHLSEKLKEKLREKYGLSKNAALPDDSLLWIRNVCLGVKELTNSASMYEGKRTWQVERARSMVEQFKPVKILDQVASIIDGGIGFRPMDAMDADIVKKADYRPTGDAQADIRAINLQLLKGEKGFALKALDLSRACRDSDRSPRQKIAKIHQFCRGVIDYFKESYNLGQEGNFEAMEERRVQFNWEAITRMMQKAKTAERLGENLPEVVRHYDSPSLEKKDWSHNEGLATVTVSEKNGTVVGFGLYVDPKNDLKQKTNRIKSIFLDTLQDKEGHKDEPWVAISTQRLQKPPQSDGLEEFPDRAGNIAIRHFTLPPMPLEDFISIYNSSRKSDPDAAISAEDKWIIEGMGRHELERYAGAAHTRSLEAQRNLARALLKQSSLFAQR